MKKTTAQAAPEDSRPLRVLIAEDEFLVGSILEEDLTDRGYDVVGLFGDLGSLQTACRTLSFDVAILDVNLAGEMVYPVADDLRARGKPFILVTGYGPKSLPESLREVQVLSKPCAFALIEKAIRREYEKHLIAPDKPGECRVASDLSEMTGEGCQKSPATLGDVLYAKSKALVPEQDWVALVQSIAGGDQAALHALYERSHRMVFTLVMRITANRETAEELTVDVYHDIWRRAAGYDAANGTVLGWIMNQARSRAIDRLRFENRKKRSQGNDVLTLTELSADPRDLLVQKEQRETLRTALAALTLAERQAIETTFFAGFTHDEAAVRLNVPLGTVKTRIRSGLHKLRRALAKEGGLP